MRLDTVFTHWVKNLTEEVNARWWRVMLFVGVGTFLFTWTTIPIAESGFLINAAALFRPPEIMLYSWIGTLSASAFVVFITLKPYRVRVLVVMVLSSMGVSLLQLAQNNGGTASVLELLRAGALGLFLPWCFAVGTGRLIFSRKYMTILPILGPVVAFGICLPVTIVIIRSVDGLGLRTPQHFELAVYAGTLAAWIGLAIHLMQKPFREADPRKQLLYAQILATPHGAKPR